MDTIISTHVHSSSRCNLSVVIRWRYAIERIPFVSKHTTFNMFHCNLCCCHTWQPWHTPNVHEKCIQTDATAATAKNSKIKMMWVTFYLFLAFGATATTSSFIYLPRAFTHIKNHKAFHSGLVCVRKVHGKHCGNWQQWQKLYDFISWSCHALCGIHDAVQRFHDSNEDEAMFCVLEMNNSRCTICMLHKRMHAVGFMCWIQRNGTTVWPIFAAENYFIISR